MFEDRILVTSSRGLIHSVFLDTDPCLRQLFTGLLPYKARFSPRPVHIGFVVDKVAV